MSMNTGMISFIEKIFSQQADHVPVKSEDINAIKNVIFAHPYNFSKNLHQIVSQ